MNLLLLDPFEVAKEYPETLTNTFKYGHLNYIKFNKKGDYLASGLRDGGIAIFDNDTDQVVAVLKQHTRLVHSIDWSACGRYLLTLSIDCNVLLWDLKTKTVIREIIFDSAAWSAELDPTNIFGFICTVYDEEPVYVDWSNEDDVKIHRLLAIPKASDSDDEAKKRKLKILALCVTFGFSGKLILMGTNKGWLNVIVRTGDGVSTVYSQKICGALLKQIVICEKNRKVFLNCLDRIIRQLSISEELLQTLLQGQELDYDAFEVDQKYQDVVNRLQWNSINVNHNGEYLIASTYGSGAHDVYMWETTMGSLIKVLEGPKEELLDTDWNNKRCSIVANGLDLGYIYLWSNIVPQKWSALAPDFVEVEENVEYEEREDEFDIVPDEELNQRQLNEEDEPIDIITKDEVDARGLLEEDSFVIPVDLTENIDAPVEDDDD